jgi:hypothetical protein
MLQDASEAGKFMTSNLGVVGSSPTGLTKMKSWASTGHPLSKRRCPTVPALGITPSRNSVCLTGQPATPRPRLLALPSILVVPGSLLTCPSIAPDLCSQRNRQRRSRARSGSTLAWPLSLPVLLLCRWFDILFSSPCSTEPVGTFLVRGARLFVRPRILLIAGVADGFFRVRLLHRFSSFDLQTRYSAVVTEREKGSCVVDSCMRHGPEHRRPRARRSAAALKVRRRAPVRLRSWKRPETSVTLGNSVATGACVIEDTDLAVLCGNPWL